MEIDPYVESIRRQLELAAEAGGEEARALAERLVAPLEAAIRLAVQDALAAAAEEITLELAPGSVELRLRGREPEFVVSLPPADRRAEDAPRPRTSRRAHGGPRRGEDGRGATTPRCRGSTCACRIA